MPTYSPLTVDVLAFPCEAGEALYWLSTGRVMRKAKDGKASWWHIEIKPGSVVEVYDHTIEELRQRRDCVAFDGDEARWCFNTQEYIDATHKGL